MIEKLLFGKPTFDEAKAALDAGVVRQRVIASNIANANTPGYRAQQVRFEELLPEPGEQAPMTKTDPAHLSSNREAPPAPRVDLRNPGTSNGINDVEIEQEMVELSENSVHYQAISQLVAGRYRGILEAIRTDG
ncbi:MAG: flagellar basal body rod protein FlgB [Candidatus Eisenbacteria bacterium]|uniref:Flagellar basal body rod protein FlgB n=1 Tax=Eiseniibacteriota bacterium TaxID=2212470 RepID=A0A956RQ84_UNCEI|nr:flagellar basal body rod protein FlgB [Candidatus Eisenbacteria bacterium]